ncbi:geraniol 8-hydroxylase-like [Punica granatum]|uniref:Geraniol 8-hydroxylase-like n=1 Tax=Punica granatum TaxID=22663 RepID=A0A6P8DU01_PUNGR|nr:geraniol 8-hydroxylase-like [Punica granatum]
MDLLLLILGLYYLSWGLLRALLYLANRGKPSMVGVLSQSKATPVVVTSAPLTGEILQTFDTLFSNRLVPDTITALRRDEFGQSWMSISLLWKNLRQICNAHLFTHKILESNQHLRRHQVQELLAHVRKCSESGALVNPGEVIFTVVLNLLASTMFSIDLADPTSEITASSRLLSGGSW